MDNENQEPIYCEDDREYSDICDKLCIDKTL